MNSDIMYSDTLAFVLSTLSIWPAKLTLVLRWLPNQLPAGGMCYCLYTTFPDRTATAAYFAPSFSSFLS